jgi:hypothetical protein
VLLLEGDQEAGTVGKQGKVLGVARGLVGERAALAVAQVDELEVGGADEPPALVEASPHLDKVACVGDGVEKDAAVRVILGFEA